MTLIIPKSIPGVTPNPGHFTAVLKGFPEILNWWSLAQSRYTADSDGTGQIILPRIGNANLFEVEYVAGGVTRWDVANGYDVAFFHDAIFGDAIRSTGYIVDLPTVTTGVKSFVWVGRLDNANGEMWNIDLSPTGDPDAVMGYIERSSGMNRLNLKGRSVADEQLSFALMPTVGVLCLNVLVVDFATGAVSLSINDSAYETQTGTSFGSNPTEAVQRLHLGHRLGETLDNQGYNGVIPEFGIVDGDVRTITGFMDAIKAQATRVYGVTYA